jgi:hypothetical protein
MRKRLPVKRRMVVSVTCDICGWVLDSDQNFYGITDENGTLLSLCSLHAETSIRVEESKRIDVVIMMKATLRLDQLRPSLREEPEEWVDWHPLDELVRLYCEIRDGKIEKEKKPASEERTGKEEFLEKKITIPGEHVREVSEKNFIEKELLAVLAFCMGREIITGEPESHISYDEYTGPVERTVRYGNREYGLSMRARPISSGVGVHGEEAEWRFYGLPAGISVEVHTRLDMRGGENNYYSLKIHGDNVRIGECISFVESVFGAEIKRL